MRENLKILPVGVLDTDSDLTRVEPGDVIESLNTRINPGSEARNNVGGNEALAYGPPVGTNEVIGYVEDKICKTGIFFIKNSNSFHTIVRYWIEEDRFEVLIESPLLMFDNTIRARVVDGGQYLLWVDGKADKEITGNMPRMLDMDLISTYEKQVCYEVHYDSASFALGAEYFITTYDANGTILTGPTLFRTSTGLDEESEALIFYLALFNAGLPITVTQCQHKIEIKANNQGETILITGPLINFVKTNIFPDLILEDYYALVNHVPPCYPSPFFVNDPAIDDNKVFGHTFQFRYRYVFRDRSRSPWGPISYVPTNFTKPNGANVEILNNEGYNKIVINFDDPILADADWRVFITGIEVAVRYEDTGVWKLEGFHETAELGVSAMQIDFFNDGIYNLIPSDSASTGGTQALKNFDFVPRVSAAIEMLTDDQGNTILALGGNIEQQNVPDCAEVVITDDVRFLENEIPVDVTTDQAGIKQLKKGGSYEFGGLYEDRYGRQSSVIKFGRYDVPWDFGFQHFPNIEVLHSPPEWATRWKLMMTKNQNQSTFFQGPVFDVVYWIKGDNIDDFTFTTFAAGDADLIAFVFDIAQLKEQASVLFGEKETQLLVQAGDRIRILLGDTGQTGDFNVEGYNLTWPAAGATVDRYSVFVRFDASLPDFSLVDPTDNHVVELYRQSLGSSDFYYEMECRDIVDPGLPTRNHGPAFDMLKGDTYVYAIDTGRFYGAGAAVVIGGFERRNLYLHKPEVGSDIGRASAVDPDYKELFAYNEFRVSDIFIPDTGQNGLPSFRGTEKIKIERALGRIQNLQMCRSVLLVICQFGTQPVYIGQNDVIDLSGDTIMGVSDKLLNLAKDTLKYGTHHPDSIVYTGRYVYGWDGYLGVPWRYAVGAGIDPINYKNIKKFRGLRSTTGTVRGSYQEEFDTYYLRINNENYGFDEQLNGWLDKFSWVPEYSGSIGLAFISFDNGVPWRHEQGDLCNFYGTQYQSEIVPVIHAGGSMILNWWNIRLQGNLWLIPELFTYSFELPAPMRSRLSKVNKWTKKEGHYWANFLRDMDDPDPRFDAFPLLDRPIRRMLGGRRLKGEVMTPRLRLENPENSGILRQMDIEVSMSNKTK